MRRYRRTLNQVGRVLRFGFLVCFIKLENERDAGCAFVERLLNGVHSFG